MFTKSYTIDEIRRLSSRFCTEMNNKWFKGVEEHGPVFNRDPLVEAMQEVQDQFWFLCLAGEERDQLRAMLVEAHDFLYANNMHTDLVGRIRDYFYELHPTVDLRGVTKPEDIIE